MALRSALDWHSNVPLLALGLDADCALWQSKVHLEQRKQWTCRCDHGASEDSIVDWGFPFRNIVVCPPNPIG